jgi:hypothetical protein
MALLLERGYAAGDQAGGREDLSDLISNVDAKSTVFTSMAKKGKKPGNALMSWQMDKYESPTVLGYVDGTDVDMTQESTTNSATNPVFVNPAKNRVLANNYVQMFRRTFRVSSLANEIQVVAGVKSELANGIAKKLVEIKRDMEMTFLNDADGQVDNGTLPYLTKSLGSFVNATATQGGSDGGQTSTSTACPVRVAAAYRTPAAQNVSTATGSLTEANIQDVLKAIYEETGLIRDYDLVCGTTLKRAFTGFTQSTTNTLAGSGSNATAIVNATASPIKTFNQDASSRSFINAIDLFEGDFGRLRLHPSTHVAASGAATTFRGYVIPFDQVEIRYGKLPQIKELTDNGGGPARLIEAVAALVVENPRNFAFFTAAS